ncbi:MAG: GNAT family N-acetyltransferase [Gordonia sp. (in: high G+C Gram-positive bacteria)]|uniref:GNAT family N-acetyltransferase n=1 Tax=Gordonia sp. (in: high G+C Gram-positive bacteria) TaxID=84139 RepID=UPI0039E69F6F
MTQESVIQNTPVPPPTVTLDPAPALRDNPDRDRYELWSGDELVGLAGYELTSEDTMTLLHVVVTEKFGQSGFARLLLSLMFDDLDARGIKAVPVCTYAQQFIERFPQYRRSVA